ncbi:hypothetical protein DV737_g2820, partial [Chaetothyriales sp. CBS 132003]
MAADPVTASTVDDLLDYNFSDIEEPFTDKANTKAPDDKQGLSPRAAKRKLDQDKNHLSLGIDEEVKIVKKRQAIAKLDEARLLSEPGIPRIRRLARSGKIAKTLGFKGKGHEFSDVARLLNYYQIWLDGLYPRAKFADGLQLIEKAGHSKRMNVVRKTWIDEGKPGYRAFEDASADQIASSSQPYDVNRNDLEDQGPLDELFFQDPVSNHAPDGGAPSEDDDLDALLAENASHSSDPTERTERTEPAGLREIDDLDALMAEQESRNIPASGLKQNQGEDEDDDLDALLAEQQSRKAEIQVSERAQQRTTIFDNEDEDEEDDLDALWAEQAALEKPRDTEMRATGPHESRAPMPNNNQEDDLDALLAEEHEASS